MKDEELNKNTNNEIDSDSDNFHLYENTDLFSLIPDNNVSKNKKINEDISIEESLDIEEELKKIKTNVPLADKEENLGDFKNNHFNSGNSNKDSVEKEFTNKRSRTADNKPNKKGKNTLKIVSIISVFLILIVVILFQFSLLLDNYKDDDKGKEKDKDLPVDLPLLNDSDKKEEDTESTKPIEVEDTLNLEVNEKTGLLNRSSVYNSDLANSILFKIGFVTEEGFSLPVSILISKDKVLNDFGVEDINEITQFDLYSRYGNSVLFKSLGFSDYHPYIGEFFDATSYTPVKEGVSNNKEDNFLILRLNKESELLYNNGDLSSEVLFNSLTDTFMYSYNKVLFEDLDGNMYKFNDSVEEDSNLEFSSELDNYAYYLYKNSNGSTFIGNNFSKTYTNVREALEAMKTSPNEYNISLIPENIDYDINIEGDVVTVKFIEELDISNYSSKELLGMIEGLNLTVSGFDKSLKLENIKQSLWQGFNFNEILENPIGANKIILK